MIRRGCCRIIACAGLVACVLPVHADDLHLKNGITLSGTVVPITGLNARTRSQNNSTDIPVAAFWMVDDGVRRFFVTQRVTADLVPDDQITSGTVSFKLEHERISRGRVPISIELFQERTDFDGHGRRRVTLKTERGLEHFHQAVTLIRPDYLLVDSTSHSWEIGLDPTSIPAETLREIIEGAIDPDRLADRQAVVVYFIQAEMYAEARNELAAMLDEFPEQQEWVERMQTEIAHFNALRGLLEIQRRREAGQHGLTYNVARQFPADRVSADVLREAQDIVADYDAKRASAEKATMLLGLLQAQLDGETAAKVAPLRAAVTEELHVETLARLDPFLRSETDETLTPAEKLALAYSGWVLGQTNALTNLDDAIRLWHARFLVLEYLRENQNPARREQLVTELSEIEGVNVPRVAEMAALLPPPITTTPLTPRVILPQEVRDQWGEVTQRYSVVLPPEYSPHHRYPLLVVMRREGWTTDDALRWWSGDETHEGPAQRHGYIVMAPEYAGEQQGNYSYDHETHVTVIDCLRDARKRFRIDSDRVFLTGHGMGGDACFDLAMTHPGVFAGAIPINGISDRYCIYYRHNAPDLAWYVVAGERFRDSLERNATDLNAMMNKGDDIIYCEYKSRGFEAYFEETPRIFDWMALHRRAANPTEWEVNVMRQTDTRFHWLEVAGLPPKLAEPIAWEIPNRRPRPMSIEGRTYPGGNAFFIKHPAQNGTLWLSPDMVDFSQRLKVTARGKQVFNGFLEPSLADLLEDLRVRGDRERMYWAKLAL